MRYECMFAQRDHNGTILCKKMRKDPYCGNIYFCPQTRQSELTEFAKDCPVKRWIDGKPAKQ